MFDTIASRIRWLCAQQLIGAKVTSATPGSIGDQTRKEAEFIKYTPNPNAPGYNNNAKQRVVRMVAAQVINRCRSLQGGRSVAVRFGGWARLRGNTKCA